MNQQPTIQTQTKPDHGAINAGVICLLIGCAAVALIPLLGWGLGAPLFLVAFILSIVAMSKNNIGRGITLLLCTLTFPWVAQVIGIAFYVGVGHEANKQTELHKQQDATLAVSSKNTALDYGTTEAERQAAAPHKRAK
jgi:hypothetical protein